MGNDIYIFYSISVIMILFGLMIELPYNMIVNSFAVFIKFIMGEEHPITKLILNVVYNVIGILIALLLYGLMGYLWNKYGQGNLPLVLVALNIVVSSIKFVNKYEIDVQLAKDSYFQSIQRARGHYVSTIGGVLYLLVNLLFFPIRII